MSKTSAVSQTELDDILHTVREDNEEHQRIPYPSSVPLSQSDLDVLLGGGAPSTTVTAPKPPAAPSETAPQSKQTAPAAESDDAAAARAAKIAERKARTAEMLARVNASSPKRVSVIYGSTLRKGGELSALRLGDNLVLDRVLEAAADILVDGKPFARGILGYSDGTASVRITELLSQ